ncbi:MAG: hypothetical protein BGO53_14145 [Sphingobacteriales bacterium 39-19]|nr:DUF4836 family protein [Sphingobacteriales bacterium]OJW10725.1 MAG: hypothetical protein BGO53_14145 [Sphingobacteriales bacterium 39-19]
MKLRYLSLVSILFLLIFNSCKKANKTGLFIPKNAAVALHIDGKALNKKVSWSEFKDNAAFKEMLNDSTLSKSAKAAFENPENTGVDIENDFLFLFVADTTGGYSVVEGNLKDAGKFKDFIGKSYPAATLSEKEGIQYALLPNMSVSWKKDRFIIMNDIPGFNKRAIENDFDPFDTTRPVITKPVSTRDLNTAIAKLYNLTESESLAKDSRFADVMSLNGDLHFWINSEAFADLALQDNMMSMMNLSKLYKGAVTGGAVNFDNGKIEADTYSYASGDITSLWKKYSGNKIDEEMIKRLPSENIAGMLAMNYKPQGIAELLKLIGVDGLANMSASKIGITLDDFIKANKGDLFLAATDVHADSVNRPNANFVFAVSIGDKTAFDKLVTAGKTLGGQAFGDRDPKIYFNSNDQYFAIGNKQDFINKYIASNQNSKPALLDKVSGNPIAGYVNFQSIFNGIKEDSPKDSIGKAMFDASIKMWDNLIMTGGNMKGDAMKGHFEVNLVDKNTNSLQQLNTYLNQMSTLQKMRYKNLNTVTFTPDTDTTAPVAPAMDMPEKH